MADEVQAPEDLPAVTARPPQATGMTVGTWTIVEQDGRELCRFNERAGVEAVSIGYHRLTARETIALASALVSRLVALGTVTSGVSVLDMLHELDTALASPADPF